MSDDAVMQALEASSQALFDLEMKDGDAFAGVVLQSIYCHADNLPENLKITRSILRQVSTAAIAAFLRALPDRFPMPGAHNPECQVWGHAAGEMRRLASAVERASAERGER